jgi:hypothetical protein
LTATCQNLPEFTLLTGVTKKTAYPFTINAFALLLHKFFCTMANKRPKGLYWLAFFFFTALFFAAIFYHWEYLTLIIPFVCTYFVLALDII